MNILDNRSDICDLEKSYLRQGRIDLQISYCKSLSVITAGEKMLVIRVNNTADRAERNTVGQSGHVDVSRLDKMLAQD